MLFETGVVLSITTGKLLCEMGRVYDILNYMTGDNLFTHQLPRVVQECKPILLQQHPELATIDANEVNKDNWQECLASYVEQVGDLLEVLPIMDDNVHEAIDPIEEAVAMMGEDRVMIYHPNYPNQMS
jgi:hypothetical protein